jgi:hypothetical protein
MGERRHRFARPCIPPGNGEAEHILQTMLGAWPKPVAATTLQNKPMRSRQVKWATIAQRVRQQLPVQRYSFVHLNLGDLETIWNQ